MTFSKIIEINISSSFGCFSKPFSTTGGVISYLIPPKTAIIGMIGAILGYEFNDYIINNDKKVYKIELLNAIKISICPLFDLKSKRVTYNQISGTVDKPDIINIHQDILIRPKYKIFISFPENLSNEQNLFLKNIKNKETVFNLYMGKNEFPLNLELINEYDGELFTFDYSSDELSNLNIFGSINKECIRDANLFYYDNQIISKLNDSLGSVLDPVLLFDNSDGTRTLKSCYEYVINDYPIKRENFIDFTFSRIGFYSTDDFEKVYFSNIVIKDNCSLELVKIGANKWLSLI